MSRSPRDKKTEELTKSWLSAEEVAKHLHMIGAPENEVLAARKETAIKKGTLLKHLRKAFLI